MVDRFTPCDWPHATMVEDSDGGYVSYYDYEKLQQRLATAEAELEACQKLCAIYYEIAASAIGEEQTIALRDAAMRRSGGRDGIV